LPQHVRETASPKNRPNKHWTGVWV